MTTTISMKAETVTADELEDVIARVMLAHGSVPVVVPFEIGRTQVTKYRVFYLTNDRLKNPVEMHDPRAHLR